MGKFGNLGQSRYLDRFLAGGPKEGGGVDHFSEEGGREGRRIVLQGPSALLPAIGLEILEVHLVWLGKKEFKVKVTS